MSAFDDSKKAVDSAAEAFKTWQFTSPAAKAAIFRKAAEIIKTDKYADKITVEKNVILLSSVWK